MRDAVTSGAAAGIDWSAVRRRLEALGAALDATHMRSPERSRALLEERAHRLARREADAAGDETIEALVFERGGESWAVETRFVVEVLRLDIVTPLPGAEAGVVGVMGWRGTPLVLRELAQGAAPTGARDGWVVALGEERPVFGLVVDAMPVLATVQSGGLHPPGSERARDRGWIRGITEDAIAVLDGEELIRSNSGGELT